jgi:adenylate cyclase
LASERVERRLTAILAADVAGYSRLMGADEEGTLAQLKAHRQALVDPKITEHRGRIVKTTGDGMLVEFASVVDAVRCAVAVQRGMVARNSGVAEDKRIEFRVGINVGDIIIDGGDIFGDGVNVAARLEGLAEPGGICVSGRVQEDARGKLDVAFEDAGEQQLKNIAWPVRVYRVRIDGRPQSAPTLVLPDKPSIAVLPFQNLSGDPEQEYFADGMVEEIITALSRSQSLFVIARNSSFAYKGRAVDVKQIARELGVRYVLEGSVRRGGNRVRITAQLIDGATGNHMWAERYDRDPADIFAVQDEITEAVAIAIVPVVTQMERHHAVRKPPESLGAWEAYQRGLWHLGRIGVTENEAARRFFRRAIDLDPSFASAYAELAIAICQGASYYQAMPLSEALDEALPMAQRAISLDPVGAAGYISASLCRHFRGDYDGALAAARQALAISPNYPLGYHLLGVALNFSGRPREALEAIRKAIRLDPHDPLQSVQLTQVAIAHYFLRDNEAAIEAVKEVLRSYPDHPWAYRWLAAALGQAGRLDEAKEALQHAIAISPKSFDMFVRQRAPWMRVEDYEHMLEGLRKAGWES